MFLLWPWVSTSQSKLLCILTREALRHSISSLCLLPPHSERWNSHLNQSWVQAWGMNHSIPSWCHTVPDIHQQSISERGQSCFEEGHNWLPCSIVAVKHCEFFLHSRFLSPGGTIKLIQSAFESYKGIENRSMKRKTKDKSQDYEPGKTCFLNTMSYFMPDCKESLV